jgi:hypothetical protein
MMYVQNPHVQARHSLDAPHSSHLPVELPVLESMTVRRLLQMIG